MTPGEFRAALDVLGLNQTTAAPVLGLDVRSVRRYATDTKTPSHRPVPPPVAHLLAALIQLQAMGA